MQKFKDLSLSVQLPVLAATSTLLVALCLLWLATTSSAYLQGEQEKQYGEALAEQVAISVRDPLQRGDLLSARASLQRFIDQSLAGGVSIEDVEGMAMGTAGTLDGPTLHQYRAPIRIGNDIAGEVIVSVDSGAAKESRWRFLFSLLALAVALSLLVFLVARTLAQRLATELLALQSQLTLPNDNEEDRTLNELARLHRRVEQLPLDMLRGHAAVPAAATEYQQGTILFVHLRSLARYVDTLSENNLHRYARRVQQIVQAAAQCYRGELAVVRPFGLLISFSPQPNAGSEALRAASCARLISLIAQGLGERTTLSLDMCMALSHCEQGGNDVDDIYPRLYVQGAIDELREMSLDCGERAVLLARGLLVDEQLALAAQCEELEELEDSRGFSSLRCLSAEQEQLLAHQAQLIIERIKPQSRSVA
jgi:uncharacterized membrane protein affecting hemolysin expression